MCFYFAEKYDKIDATGEVIFQVLSLTKIPFRCVLKNLVLRTNRSLFF